MKQFLCNLQDETAISRLDNGTIQFPRQNYPSVASAHQGIENFHNQMMRLAPALKGLKNDAIFSRNNLNDMDKSSLALYDENYECSSPNGASDNSGK